MIKFIRVNNFEMIKKVSCIYKGKKYLRGTKDEVLDYYVYHFTNVKGEDGVSFGEKWIKETKLLSAVHFIEGEEYEITLSNDFFNRESRYMPYPIDIIGNRERVYMKNGNSILRVESNGQEENLSVPINKVLGISNYEIAALNKLCKGEMTIDLLLKMNARGVYYRIEESKSRSIVMNREGKNIVYVKGKTKEEIEKKLSRIKKFILKEPLHKHFNFVTELT